jgi:hypothetical protein
MTHSVFHIIPENPEIKHVPDEMHPAAMEEHGRKNVFPAKEGVKEKFRRDQRPGGNERFQGPRGGLMDLQIEHPKVNEDEKNINKGKCSTLYIVF